MDKVDIYIAQDRKGPRAGNGKYIVVIELKEKNATRTLNKAFDEISSHGLELNALRDALNRFKRECSISIHSEHGWFEQCVQNGNYEQWQQTEWKNAKGELITHSEIWSEIRNNTESKGLHIENIDKDMGEYKTWLENELKK